MNKRRNKYLEIKTTTFAFIQNRYLAFERSKVDLCGKSLVEHIIDDIGIML
jgi:hypothetical protein